MAKTPIPYNTIGSTLGTITQRGAQFVQNTARLAKTDPCAAGGRCLGAGTAAALGGLAGVAVGATLESLGMASMVLGGCALFLTNDPKLGGKLFAGGATAFVAGKTAQVAGLAAMVAGGASAAVGTGMVAYSATRKQSRPALPPATTEVGHLPSSQPTSDTKQPFKSRLRVTVIDV
jgi:hypothetical protein